MYQNTVVDDIYENFKSIYLSKNFPKPYYSNNIKRCNEIMIENREELTYYMFLLVERNYNDLESHELVELALKINNELKTDSFWDSFTYLFPNYHNGLRLYALQAVQDQLEDINPKHKMKLLSQLEIFQNENIFKKIMKYVKLIINFYK